MYTVSMIMTMMVVFTRDSECNYQLQSCKAGVQDYSITSAFHLPGVQFVHVRVMPIKWSNMSQTVNLQEYGFCITFPPNVSAKPEFILTIGVGLSGSFDLPKSTTLVSAIYYIETSFILLRPVKIEIEHCVSTKNINKLTFARAHTGNQTPPYQFKSLTGGSFTSGLSWGVIEVSTFSLYAILAGGTDPPIDYSGYLLSSDLSGGNFYGYHVLLLIIRELNTSKKVNIENKYSPPQWRLIMQPFTFKFINGSSVLTLEISEYSEKKISGYWEIEPMLLPLEVDKSDIDLHDSGKCQLIATWTNDEGVVQPVPLKRTVFMTGINKNAFKVYINPHLKDYPQKKGDDTQYQAGTEIKKRYDLFDAVKDVGNWWGLCSNLGVDDAIMNSLEHSNEPIGNGYKKQTCLRAFYDSGDATWEKVIKAVAKYPLSNVKLAKEIAKMYDIVYKDEL